MFVFKFNNYENLDSFMTSENSGGHNQDDMISEYVVSELIHQDIINKLNLLNNNIFLKEINIIRKNELEKINSVSKNDTRIFIFGVPDNETIKSCFSNMSITIGRDQYLLMLGGDISVVKSYIDILNWCVVISFSNDIPDIKDSNYKYYRMYCKQLKYQLFRNLDFNFDNIFTIGEIIDKHSILQIKRLACKDNNTQKTVEKMIGSIENNIPDEIEIFYDFFLKAIGQTNKILWDLEDKIRILNTNQLFNQEFIETSRNIIKTNNLRSELKKKINNFFSSEFHDFKIYN